MNKKFQYKPVFTAIKSEFDEKLEADLNLYEKTYGYRSNRIRPVIASYGWINAIERTVSKNQDSSSFIKLIELNLTHLAWEHFVLAHKDLFTERCIRNASARLGVH
jgi:hypothetical protein